MTHTISIPSDQQILHTTKQEFIIDGQDGIAEPIGMSKVRLEVKVNNFSSTSSLQNIIKCLEMRIRSRKYSSFMPCICHIKSL